MDSHVIQKCKIQHVFQGPVDTHFEPSKSGGGDAPLPHYAMLNKRYPMDAFGNHHNDGDCMFARDFFDQGTLLQKYNLAGHNPKI